MVDLIDFEDDFGDLFEEWSWITFTTMPDDAAGRAQNGTPSAPAVLWAMPPQPVNESELIKDIGGQFVRDLQKTYTGADIQIRQDDKQSDWLSFKGITYEVYKISDRRSLGNYQKVYIKKLQGDK